MDPNAALREFRQAMQDAAKADDEYRRDDENDALWAAVGFASSLFNWLKDGGFPPDWSVQP